MIKENRVAYGFEQGEGSLHLGDGVWLWGVMKIMQAINVPPPHWLLKNTHNHAWR
jgi:hypothetical protein